jgi:hypothetical protein
MTVRHALLRRGARAPDAGKGGGGFGGDHVGAGATVKLEVGVASHGAGGGGTGGGEGGALGIDGGLVGGVEGGSQGDVTSETPASGMVRDRTGLAEKCE